MGKSTTNLPVQSPGQEVSHARNPLIAVTHEAASVTHRENEVCLGTQPRNTEVPNRTACVFIEWIMEDCNEDSDEGSDPPTRSFLRRRLDEQSRQIEQTVIQKMNNLLESRQLPPKSNPLQVKTGSTWLKTIDLEKNEDQAVDQTDPTRKLKQHWSI
ncbi:hypothetical protein ACFXTH_032635 [Malus domestica]